MDKVLEKFGIFDWMGVWGPGAIAVTYYLFTAHSFFCELFAKLNISLSGISEGYLLIFLYTAVAYTVGVILHEIGKIIYDIFKWSDSESITYFNINYKMKPRLNPFNRIKYDYNKTIDFIKFNNVSLKSLLEKNSQTPISFEEARSKLKYSEKINTKRMDTYHSIYALARSRSVAFVLHIFLILFSLFKSFQQLIVIY